MYLEIVLNWFKLREIELKLTIICVDSHAISEKRKRKSILIMVVIMTVSRGVRLLLTTIRSALDLL